MCGLGFDLKIKAFYCSHTGWGLFHPGGRYHEVRSFVRCNRPNQPTAKKLKIEKVKVLAVQPYPTLCGPTDWPTRLLCPWDSPGKSTEVSCFSQGIFPTQGLNPSLLHCRQVLYLLTTIREKPEMDSLIALTVVSWLILEISIKASKTKHRSTKLKDF